MKKNITPLLFGIVFILAGIGYMGNVFFNWHFEIFFDGWWTLFIIVPSFVSILANGPRSFNIAAFCIGATLLIAEQFPNIIGYRQRGIAIFSIAVIGVGITLIAGFFRKPTSPKYYTYPSNNAGANPNGTVPPQENPNPNQPNNNGYTYTSQPNGGYTNPPNGARWYTDETNCPNYNAILSGVTTKNTSTNFEGARVSVVLGGADIDFRNVVVSRDVTIYVTSILGGADIYAPMNVRIAMSKTDILGGTECTAYTLPPESGAPIVTFVCTCVLGGIDIK